MHTHALVRTYKHINTRWDTCTYVRTYILTYVSTEYRTLRTRTHVVSSQRASTMAARSRLVSTCTYVHTYVRTHQTLYSHSSTPEPLSGNSITHMQPHLPNLDNHLRRPHKYGVFNRHHSCTCYSKQYIYMAAYLVLVLRNLPT